MASEVQLAVVVASSYTVVSVPLTLSEACRRLLVDEVSPLVRVCPSIRCFFPRFSFS